MLKHTTRESTDEDNRTPPSLPVGIKGFLKEKHLGKAHGDTKALDESHALIKKIYKICCSSTVKRSGATVEDVNPGIQAAAQYGHQDREWAGPTTPSGMHPDYLLRKTSRSF